ncbi:MAG TPA: hypothetical protein PLL78_03175 [Fimbriimonadaceae bacterium]|nr:hypothetical protein [Fimbriimonadaceae bacterium]HRJ95662.1 hypothetical protein [Fimbriimonadaceae bacterium]
MSKSADSQPTPKALVQLQPTTPGTQQVGHANLSGSMIAGQFLGGGVGLTGVNADLLDGLDSTAFLQSVPLPLTLSGTNGTHIIRGENASTTNNSSGVFGYASAATGTTYGVYGRTNSPDGFAGYFEGTGYFSTRVGIGTTTPTAKLHLAGTPGVDGLRFPDGTLQTTAAAGGGSGTVTSINQALGITLTPNPLTTTGTIAIDPAVVPQLAAGNTFTGANTLSNAANSFTGNGAGLTALNATNITSGTLNVARLPVPLDLSGTNSSHIIQGVNAFATNGPAGVYGLATAGGSGITYGVRGRSSSTNGRGVFGEATASTGETNGVRGESDSTNGSGVLGVATSGTGFNKGVYGLSSSTNGVGVHGRSEAYGVQGTSNGGSGRGVYGEATATLGANYGVYGSSSSNTGFGVFGIATATTGSNYGT